MAAAAGALHGMVTDAAGQGGSGRANRASDELCDQSATELSARIRRRDVSAREVVTAHLARIERVNPRVNAIVTLATDRAMAEAARADELAAKGGPLGVLHGLPIAHKDLLETAGIRTTKGSLFYRDTVPARDALLVTRVRAAGAITLGKTNTPEFGAGSQTFNSVFGATRNPYDLTKTCGGSSGGAAVSLACGMVPARRRLRRRWLAPQSRRLLQRRRSPAIARSCADRNQRLAAVCGVGANGAFGRGRCAAAERDGW